MRRRCMFCAQWVGWLILTTSFTACSLYDLVGSVGQGSNDTDPVYIKNKNGAIAFYNKVQIGMTQVMAKYPYNSGILSDELQMNSAVSGVYISMRNEDWLDSRNIWDEGNGGVGFFDELNQIRGGAVEGLGLLRKYAPDLPTSYQGHLYALKAYAELLLAEIYCSGIPLSEPIFEGDFYYTPGYPTDSVVRHALALFDTAAMLAADSARIFHLIQVGRGRAWLTLGDYARASAAVKDVPDAFEYVIRFSQTIKKTVPSSATNFANIADREGGNGLPFRSDGDPRIALPRIRDSLGPLPFASGVEARLIEAEAALHTEGDTGKWLSLLNALRTTCTDASDCPSPEPAGTGGVGGLALLTDPGIPDERINLVFSERANWLYLTGHRQGDLRRLVRVYGRPRETVYPMGVWGSDGLVGYGRAVSIPVPDDEHTYNPMFKGCVDE